MHPSDEELIQKAKAKDKQAFTEIFDRYKNRILGYLYRYIGDYQKAEDLTIETFLNAYNSLDGYKEMGMLSSWLYRIATNCAKKSLRKMRQAKEVSLEEPLLDGDGSIKLGDLIVDANKRPDSIQREKELKEFVYKAISKLDAKYKDVLILCDIEGLSYEEASRILNSNPVTIGTRLRRARKMLFDILKKYDHEL